LDGLVVCPGVWMILPVVGRGWLLINAGGLV
jgi:hypothetical protein